MTSNTTVEQHLAQLAKDLEQHVNADVLAWNGHILYGCDDAIHDAMEERADKRPALLFMLNTWGGYIGVVERIVHTIRKHYNEVNFIIPNMAISAGTVLVMSGDAIYMDYYSILGPIDPQVERPGTEKLVPAMGYLTQYERLLKRSEEGILTTAELAFMIEKFDPAELYYFEQARNLSITLLRSWLAAYKFKNWQKTERRGLPVTDEMREKRAQEVAESLNDPEKWHTHGRGIPMDVLRRDLRLKIEDFGDDPQLSQKVKAYYTLLVDYMGRRSHSDALHAHSRYVAV